MKLNCPSPVAKKSPNEAKRWEPMLSESPTNSYYWFEMRILRTLANMKKRWQRATGVNLSPDASYQPRLADTLPSGPLDESEQTYKQMLRDHPDRPSTGFGMRSSCTITTATDRGRARSIAKAQSSSPNWSYGGELESLRVNLSRKRHDKHRKACALGVHLD